MLERKIINKGQGFRITSSGPWDNQSETLVVAMPKTRRPEFRVHPVKSIGVVGQTQLTFDNLETAQQYLDTFPDWRDTMSVGWTNKDYDCYKIPVVDGNGHVVDAWLSTRCFPQINTTQGGELKMMFPNYFTVESNEINESLNLTEQEISEIAKDESLSDDEKCRKLGETNFEEVKNLCSIIYLYHQDDIETIRNRLNNKNISKDDLKPLSEHLDATRESRFRISTFNLFIRYNESEPLTVKESFEGYTEGGISRYSPKNWGGCVQLCIDTWKPLSNPPKAKKGFFTESLQNLNFTDQEIRDIMAHSSSANDASRKLFDRSNSEYVCNICHLPFVSGESYIRRLMDKGFIQPTEENISNISATLHSVVNNVSYNHSLNHTGRKSLFFDQSEYSSGFNLFEDLIRAGDHFVINQDMQPSWENGNREDFDGQFPYALAWGTYIKNLIIAIEGTGLVQPEIKVKKGFFTESYTETVFDTHETWKIKTPGSYCYRIKINIPNKRFRTFRGAFSSMTAYGGGPGWAEMCFLTKEEADQFIQDHRLNQQGVAPQQGWYSYSARIPLTLVKVPLLDGTEAYLRKEAFPRDDTEEGQAWWSEMSQIYPEYFGKIKKGFFMENLDEALTVQKFNNLDNDLIKRIILQHVQKYGYMGGSYGNHNNNGTSYRGSPTVSEIIHILDSDGDLSQFACEPEVLTGMNGGVSQLVPEGSYADYETKCKEIWEKPHMAKEDLSMAASFCSRYFRNLEYMERQRQRQERERQHQAEIESESNVGAGQVGEQVSFVVREASYNYGVYGTMWTMKDTQGRTFTGGDSKGETKIEPNDKITGKIRQLTEFRGIKQTRIWRISITKSNGVKKGFFESIDTINSWLFKTTGLTEEDLDKLCDDNWEYRIDSDEPFMLHSEEYETGVVNPFYDDCGYRKYNLENACKFGGEEFIKTWIKYFIDWVKEHNYPIPQNKPHKGFFE